MRALGTLTRPDVPALRPHRWWRLAAAIALRLSEMAERRRSRRALLALNDAQLKDIGLSRGDAYREGARPFWD